MISAALLAAGSSLVVPLVTPTSAQSHDREVIVSADWDGDGWDTFGIVDRSTNPGDPVFDESARQLLGRQFIPDIIFAFGSSTSQPIVGDRDGDDIPARQSNSYLPRNPTTPGWRTSL